MYPHKIMIKINSLVESDNNSRKKPVIAKEQRD